MQEEGTVRFPADALQWKDVVIKPQRTIVDT